MLDLAPPATLWVPEYPSTNGDLAAEVAVQLGVPLDPEQRLIADAVYAESAPGVPQCFECVAVAARQNLKTLVLIVCAITDLFVMGAELITWTAHLFDTTSKAFQAMTRLIDANPDFRRRCREHRIANGSMAIELLTGERIEFKTRSSRSGRGVTGDIVVLDEALYLDASSMGNLLPTLATRPAAQVRYGSSGGVLGSAVLRSLRARGQAGADPRFAYVEWGAPRVACEDPGCSHLPVGRSGCALDRRDLWAIANPAMGRRISEERIADFRRALEPDEFAREFLVWWDDPEDSADEKIPAAAWLGCKDDAKDADDRYLSQIVGVPRFVIDVTPDRKRASLGAAGFRSDGLPHLEVIRNDAGTAWLTDTADLKSAVNVLRRAGATEVAVDGKSPAKSLVPALEDAGLTVAVLSLDDMAQACGALSDAVIQRAVRHLGQHELSYALAGAAVRDVGDGQWAWSRKHSDADISALVAVTGAFGRLTEPKAQPPATANTAPSQPSNLYRPSGRLSL